jgi:LacI family transcriptional regulator
MTQVAKKVTLKDIAQEIGCSKAVVSTVLNQSKGNTGVSQAMRERIEHVAAQMGYRPNFSSQSLARQRTQTLGAYIPPQPWGSIGSNYESVIFRGIEKACQELDYDLLVFNRFGELRHENCAEKLYQRRVDGLFLVHAHGGSDWLEGFLKTGVPIVGVDYTNPEPEIDAVSFDNVGAIHQAMNHLIELGHRRIAYLGQFTERYVPDQVQRRQAYLDGMKMHGLQVQDDWLLGELNQRIPHAQDHCDQIADRASHYINSIPEDHRPTAIITYNDMAAVNLIQDLMEMGIDVPGQISVVSVDDSYLCRVMRPRITSMLHPLEEMGYRATQLLHNRIVNPAENDSHPIHELYSSEVVIRQTTAVVRR